MATIDLGKIKQVWRGTYNNSTAYTVDDLVENTDSGITATYICVANSTGNAPSSSGTAHASWNYMAKGVADPIPSQSGNSGKILGTNGSVISWVADQGGELLQVVHGATSGTSNLPETGSGSIFADASNSRVDITSLNITPASTNSRILIFGLLESEAYNSSGNGAYGGASFFRGTSSGTILRQFSQGSSSGSYFMLGLNMFFLDSPNTTSSQTYTFCIERWSSSTNKHTVYQWQFMLAEIAS